MESIPNSGGYINLRGGIFVHQNGVELKRHGAQFVPSSEGRRTRGEIRGFSAAARRRLRLALLSSRLREDGFCCGVTLTLPWAIDDGAWDDAALDDFRAAWGAFRHAWERRYPRSALIYRVELQRRGAPHVHAVCHFAGSDCRIMRGMSTRSALLPELLTLWARSLGSRRAWTLAASRGGFMRRGVSVDEVKSSGAIVRYLCDHASKRKQAQLGYKGKQWGFLNRRNLVTVKARRVELSDRAETLFRRAVSRICRYRLNKGRHALAPFGSHLSPRRGGNGVRYGLSLEAVERLREWAEIEAHEWGVRICHGSC